jgi:hypothetical protein
MSACTQIELNMTVEDDAGRLYSVHVVEDFWIEPLNKGDPPHCKIAHVHEITLSQNGIDMHGDRRTLIIPIPAR